VAYAELTGYFREAYALASQLFGSLNLFGRHEDNF
jgi:hypothetical protein